MHLLPADRRHRHVVGEHEVCDALEALGEPGRLRPWADRFATLADPGRLALLVCIHQVPGICVTDLAVAADMTDNAVSQALRLLRAAGAVTDERDGRVVRYRLADPELHELLHHLPSAVPAKEHA